MKLLQFGESSSLFKSTKFVRGGNHDSVVWLRRLLPADDALDCCDWETTESGERSSTSFLPLDNIANTDASLAVIVDDLLLGSRSADKRRGGGGGESSSSSSSLMLIKFKFDCVFLGALPQDSRPSRQARATKRFFRFVSELTERETDVADTDIAVLCEGLRSRVGDSGREGSVMRKDWSAVAIDSWGKESRGEIGLIEACRRTLLRIGTGPGFTAGVGTVVVEMV